MVIMVKNNKGFTLIELIASMVILGLLMAITVPNIVGILKQNKNNVYTEDANKLISAAKYKISSNNKGIDKPKAEGSCTVYTLGFLDNSEFNSPPNGGVYLKENSFVVIKKVGNSYKYYVRLVERKKVGDTTYSGIKFKSEAQLAKDKENHVEYNITPLSNNLCNVTWDVAKQVVNEVGANCTNIHTFSWENKVSPTAPPECE